MLTAMARERDRVLLQVKIDPCLRDEIGHKAKSMDLSKAQLIRKGLRAIARMTPLELATFAERAPDTSDCDEPEPDSDPSLPAFRVTDHH